MPKDELPFSVSSLSDAGGYPTACFNHGEVDPKFVCNKCKRILKSPCQLNGVRYCHNCIHKDGNVDEEEEEIQPDKAIERQMLRSLLHCRCDRPGCPFEGDLRSFCIHYDNCDFDVITCPHCKTNVKRSQYTSHLTNDCSQLEISCEFCGKLIPKSAQEEHLQRECQSNVCLFGCELQVPTNMLQHHEEKHVEHIFALEKKLKQLSANKPDYLNELAALDQEFLDITLQSLRADIESHRKASQAQNKEPGDEKKDKQDSAIGTDERNTVMRNFLSLTDDEDIRELKSKVDDMQESCRYLSTYVRKSFEELVDISSKNANNARELDLLRGELGVLKRQFETQVNTSSRMETEIRHLETTTDDGLFVFRIPNWSKLMETAKNNDNFSIYSTTFFTHQGGYRLRMRVFPNGEKEARSSFMSAYINIMKGPYDQVLPWPFRRSIVISLLDQRDMRVMNQNDFAANNRTSPSQVSPITDVRKDISYRLRPDPTRSEHLRAFGIPTTAENPSIGFLRFAPLNSLHEANTNRPAGEQTEPMYCRDDVVFLRCAIEPVDP